MENLNKALKCLRVYHDLTQVELATKLRISKSHLSEIETGKKLPTIHLLVRYAEVFGVPVSSILFFAENFSNSASVNVSLSPKIEALLKFLSLQRAQQ
jgi:DNA-binding XRE family transcriptional regulator